MLSRIYHKLAIYEYSLSNFYKKIGARDNEYSSFFNQLAIDEKKHSKMLFALLDKRKEIIPTKYLVEAIELSNLLRRSSANKTKETNLKVSTTNPLFYLIFRGKPASSYNTYELLSFVSNGERIAYLYYSLLLYIVKLLYFITENKLYELDIKIISLIRDDEKNHSKIKR